VRESERGTLFIIANSGTAWRRDYGIALLMAAPISIAHERVFKMRERGKRG